MLFLLLSGCGSPFFLLFSVAISSLLCSFIINSNGVVDADTSIHSQKITTTRVKPFYINTPKLITRFINNNNNQQSYYPGICQSDDDSEFCNLFNDGNDDYDSSNKDHSNNEDECSFLENIIKPSMSKHYACPPSSLAALRKRYGTRKSIWGEWTPAQTRQFYKSQLPKAFESKRRTRIILFSYLYLPSVFAVMYSMLLLQADDVLLSW